MKERTNWIILTIALISLILSIIALVYSTKENSDKNINIKEEVLGSCRLKSGPIPSPDVADCVEACNFASNQECIFGIERNGGEVVFIGCKTSLDSQSNFLETSYQCLCC